MCVSVFVNAGQWEQLLVGYAAGYSAMQRIISFFSLELLRSRCVKLFSLKIE